MLALGGSLGGQRLFSRQLVGCVTRNYTGDRLNELVLDYAPEIANFGLGVRVRGELPDMLPCGSLAGPRTFLHGAGLNGVAWSDPDTGVSFAFLNNAYVPRVPRRWITGQMDRMSNIVHSAVE
ncbi:hypothetical protein BE61_01870 [Bradyrhizobium elkanii USDA 61]|nr:hypothetical protein BE61_01870 [Bradyrhizobium elkanii USDA 61]